MKNQASTLFIIFLLFGKSVFCQTEERFDIASYAIPAGWVKETGNDFVAYTIVNNSTSEYARILVFKSLPGTGKVETDFDTEWQELVQLNYKPGEFTNASVSEYKDGWTSKIGVAPFQYQNKNHAAILLTLAKEQTKMSSVFISNTVKYQADFENFGSSLNFGNSASKGNQQMTNNPNKSSAAIPPEKQEKSQVPPASFSGNFQYSTSNFDDGWVATIQNDWVLVGKGNSRVYLYYAVPYNSDNFSGTGVMDRDYYWDNYIAKQFSTTTKQYNDAGEFISSLKPKYVEGWGVDPVSGKSAFIAMTLTVIPNAGKMTVASFPDEASFRQAFPKANDQYVSDLTEMSRYNKFAIGQNDIFGTWQNGNTSTMQWAYETPSGYEGYAGMTVASSSATFNFNTNGTYSSIHNGATGAVGNMSTYQQEYKGNYNVSNWQITATNRYEGKTDNFSASFTAIRGGRILKLNNGAGQDYSLVKVK